MTTYFVTGCNISALCENKDRALWWIEEIIRRGGIPDIRVIDAEEDSL